MQKQNLRIGTRDSALALWQAQKVQHLLQEINIESSLVPTKSEGDLDLITPLYAMGVTGVFTKTLDAALLNNKIDIAVHSMKDVPIELPEGLIQAAVLERGNSKDVLVVKNIEDFNNKIANQQTLHIGTGSVRRKAQWLAKYSNSEVHDLRGNIATRLSKLHNSHWDAAIFAAAALERLQITTETVVELDWMLPAPAQGAIMVVCRIDDTYTLEIVRQLNHEATAASVNIERTFLKLLMGGCSAPIGASVSWNNEGAIFKGNVASVDGSVLLAYDKHITDIDFDSIAHVAAENLISLGAKEIIDSIKLNKQ